MNDGNLKPFRKGEARARDAGRTGGIASGVAKRERMKTLLLEELSREHTYVPADEDGLFSLDSQERPAGYTRRAAVAKKLVSMAVQGDLKAIKLLLDLTEGSDEEDEKLAAEA